MSALPSLRARPRFRYPARTRGHGSAQPPLSRFIAESPHELEPHGRWRTMLEELFRSACKSIEGEDDLGEVGEIVWFRTARMGSGPSCPPARRPRPGPRCSVTCRSHARTTLLSRPISSRGPTTRSRPPRGTDWKLDLNDEVIARWRGPAESSGDLTLVWGTPLVPGAVAVAAEIEDETLDQCAGPASEVPRWSRSML